MGEYKLQNKFWRRIYNKDSILVGQVLQYTTLTMVCGVPFKIKWCTMILYSELEVVIAITGNSLPLSLSLSSLVMCRCCRPFHHSFPQPLPPTIPSCVAYTLIIQCSDLAGRLCPNYCWSGKGWWRPTETEKTATTTVRWRTRWTCTLMMSTA